MSDIAIAADVGPGPSDDELAARWAALGLARPAGGKVLTLDQDLKPILDVLLKRVDHLVDKFPAQQAHETVAETLEKRAHQLWVHQRAVMEHIEAYEAARQEKASRRAALWPAFQRLSNLRANAKQVTGKELQEVKRQIEEQKERLRQAIEADRKASDDVAERDAAYRQTAQAMVRELKSLATDEVHLLESQLLDPDMDDLERLNDTLRAVTSKSWDIQRRLFAEAKEFRREATKKADRTKNARAKLGQALGDLHRIVAGASPQDDEATIDARHERLVKSLVAVAERMPSCDDTVTFKALVTSVRAAIMQRAYDKCEMQLAPDLANLKSNGDQRKATISLEVGAAFGAALGVEALTVEATYLHTIDFTISRKGDKFKASFQQKGNVRVGAKGGQGPVAAKGGIQGGLASLEERTYDTIADLVVSESELLMQTVTTGPNAKRRHDFVKQRAKLVAEAYAIRDQLQDRLLALGALRRTRGDGDGADSAHWTGPTETLQSDPPERIDVVRTRKQIANVNADVTVKAQVHGNLRLDVGLGVSASTTSQRDFKTISFLDDIAADEVLQDLHMFRDSGQMRFVPDSGAITQEVGGDDAVAALRELGRTIKLLRAAADSDSRRSALGHIGDTLRTNLELLRMEYDGYVDLTNGIASGQFSSTSVKEQRDLYPKARRIPKGDPGKYLRALSVQFAVLRRLYESTYGADLPSADREALDAFGKDLKTPRIKLSIKTLTRAFGLDAVSDESHVDNKTFSAQLTVQATGTSLVEPEQALGQDDPSGTEKTKKGTAGIAVAVTWSQDDTYEPGSAVPKKTWKITLGLGQPGGSYYGTDNDLASDEKFITAVSGKLLNLSDITDRLGLDKQQADGLAVDCKVALAKLAARGKTIDIELAQVEGRWCLKTATAYDQVERTVGARISAPATPGVNVVAGLKIARARKTVRQVYHGSSTLAVLTAAYREQHHSDPADHGSWEKFRTGSKLLDRIAGQLVKDTDPNGSELPALLHRIRSLGPSKAQEDAKKLREAASQHPGIVPEMVGWLVDLQASTSEDDRAAAKGLIDDYLADTDRRRKQLGSKPDLGADAKGIAALADRLDALVQRKAAKEDAEAGDPFHRHHGFTRDEINAYVAERLATRMADLASRVDAKDDGHITSVDELRSRAFRRYNKSRKAPDFRLLSEVMALDYAVKTLDDLTELDDDADKNKAIGMLGADLDKVLNGQEIYLDPRIDGWLVRRPDGTLAIEPRVKKSLMNTVSEQDVTSAVADMSAAISRATGDAGLVKPFRRIVVVNDDGSLDQNWNEKLYDADAANGYFMRRARKLNIFWPKRVGRAKTNFEQRRKNPTRSIGKLLQLVMKDRADKLARQRQAGKQRRRAATVAQ